MDWYIVVKTINGRRYHYRQKTWREGKRVRTCSEYIGPADSASAGGQALIPTAGLRPLADTALGALLDETRELDQWEEGWSDDEEFYGFVHDNRQADALPDRLGIVSETDLRGPRYGVTADRIAMPPKSAFFGAPHESATETYYSTLLHEVVHATGHPNRLDRNLAGTVANVERYAREELVAELGCIILMRHLGIIFDGGMPVHTTYFLLWLKRAGNREAALRYAKREALRAVHYILERGIIST